MIVVKRLCESLLEVRQTYYCNINENRKKNCGNDGEEGNTPSSSLVVDQEVESRMDGVSKYGILRTSLVFEAPVLAMPQGSHLRLCSKVQLPRTSCAILIPVTVRSSEFRAICFVHLATSAISVIERVGEL